MLDFEKIKELEPITIVGHINADVDSVISCILMSNFLNFKGIKNEIKMLDYHIDENLEHIGINILKHRVNISDTEPLFVVDSSYAFPNPIVGCIDHHPDKPNTSFNYINKESTACAKIIYDLMSEEGYEFSNEELKYICFALFMDSCSFKNSKSKEEDKEFAKETIANLGLDYNWFYEKGLCLNDLSKPLSQVCSYGLKKYRTDNFVFCSSYIQVNEDIDRTFEINCINYIKEQMLLSNIPFWVFIIHNVESEVSKYIEIEENNYYVHYKIGDGAFLSRGKDIVPRVLKEQSFMSNMDLIMNDYSPIIKTLIDKNISISTMESCTAGLLASTITDTEGASSIMKGAFVTYSNEAKVLQGVPKETIDEFGVYSYETARDMSIACSKAYNSRIGIGITGTTGNIDENNPDSIQGEIYYCIKFDDNFYLSKIGVNTTNLTRKTIKKLIIDSIMAYLKLLLEMPY